MRIYGGSERAKVNLRNGRERARLERVAHFGDPIRPPDRGLLLKTIRVTDHVSGVSYTITLHQGDRLNNIEPRLFGRPFMRTVTCGFDTFFRSLRNRWALRWLVE